MCAMDYKVIEKRLQAAHAILQVKTIDRATFDSLKTLLSGVHPRIDKILGEAGKAFKHADQLQKGDVIELVLETIPEATPEDKKRKKAILLFLKWWNDLKSEVARVQKEFDKDPDTKHHSNSWGNILGAAKGPLGIITVVAAGVVLLQVSEVSVTIKNMGCDTIAPPAIRIPGLKLPSSIPTNGEAVAKVPPLTVTVDATRSNSINLTAYGIQRDFSLGSQRMQFVFDGKILNGTSTIINLASQKDHTLVVTCE